MQKLTMKTLLCFTVLFVLQCSDLAWAKPGGEYGTIGDYATAEIGGAYQTVPDTSALLTPDLKSAGSYDIGYGAPLVSESIYPAVFPLRSFGGGWGSEWKQPIPQHFIQVVAKPIPVPVGWGWQNPGIF